MAPQKEFLSQKNHCTQEGGDVIEMELEEKRRERETREKERRGEGRTGQGRARQKYKIQLIPA